MVQIIYSGVITVNNLINNVPTCMKGASIPVTSYDPSNTNIVWTDINNKGMNNNYLPLPNTSTIKTLTSKYQDNPNVTITYEPQFQITQKQVSRVNNSFNLLMKSNTGNYRGMHWNYWIGNYCKQQLSGSTDTCQTAFVPYSKNIYCSVKSNFKCNSLMNPGNCNTDTERGKCCGSTGCFTYDQQFNYGKDEWIDDTYPVEFRVWSLKVCGSGSLCNGGSCTCHDDSLRGTISISMQLLIKVTFDCTNDELESPYCIKFCEQQSNLTACMSEYNDYCGISTAKTQAPIGIKNGGCRQFYHTALPTMKNTTTDAIINRYCQNRYNNLGALIDSINSNPSNSTVSLCACHMRSSSYKELASQLAEQMNGINPAAIQGACLVNACVNTAYRNSRYTCTGPACMNIVAVNNGGNVNLSIDQQCLVSECAAYPNDPVCKGNVKPPQPQPQPQPQPCNSSNCSCSEEATCQCSDCPTNGGSGGSGSGSTGKKISKKTIWILVISCIIFFLVLLIIIIIIVLISRNKNNNVPINNYVPLNPQINNRLNF